MTYINSPYFVSFQPNSIPPGTGPVTSVIDMISFSPEIPTSSILIDYNIGASGSYSFIYTIKNITTNTKISASMDVNEYFTARVLTPIVNVTSNGFVLDPLQTGSILISLNTASLVQKPGYQDINGGVTLRISNVGLPTQSLKDLTTSLLTASKFLISPIEVV